MNFRTILCAIAMAAAAQAAAAPRYIYVFHNLNSFVGTAEQELAVEAYKGLEEVARRNGITVEPFFTGLSFDMYLRKAPELLEALKKSGRDWHHHGANRPPNPQPIQRVANKTWPEAIRAMEEYESSALDIRTGKLDPSRPGGLTRMVEYFGRPPLSTGRFVRAPIMAAIKDRYGAKIGVGTHDWFGVPSSWLWYMGTLNRPDDAFVHPNWDFMEWVRVEWAVRRGEDPKTVKRSRPNEPWDIFAKIDERLKQLDPDTPAFLVFGFHNNDLFGFNFETKTRFEPEYRKYFLEKMDEFLKWAVQKKGFQPVTLRRAYDMARANFITPTVADAPVLASQIVESVDKQKSLPLYVRAPKSGHSLAEAWQALAAALMGRQAEVKDLLGPVELAPPSAQPVRATGEEVRAAARALPAANWIPARVSVAGKQANAGEFLYLMARVVAGAKAAEAPPIAMTPPVTAREERFGDALSLLQMWTYKPAYFGKAGARLQRATSVEVNLRTGRMQRDDEMRLLRPEDRPPW